MTLTIPTFEQCLVLARQVAAQDPPKKTSKWRDPVTGRDGTTAPPEEMRRVGRAALTSAGLFLRALDSTVGPDGLTQHWRLTHMATGLREEWATTTPLNPDVPPDLAVKWARSQSLVGVLHDLLWPEGEEVPDPSERPRESRTQRQVQEDARRAKTGAHLPDRNERGEPAKPSESKTIVMPEAKGFAATKREAEWRANAQAAAGVDDAALPSPDELPVFPPVGATEPKTEVIEPPLVAESHRVWVVSTKSPASPPPTPSQDEGIGAKGGEATPPDGAVSSGAPSTETPSAAPAPEAPSAPPAGEVPEKSAPAGGTGQDNQVAAGASEASVLPPAVPAPAAADPSTNSWCEECDHPGHAPGSCLYCTSHPEAESCSGPPRPAVHRNAVDMEAWPPALRGDFWERGFTLQRTTDKPGHMDVLRDDVVVAEGLSGEAARAWLHEQEEKEREAATWARHAPDDETREALRALEEDDIPTPEPAWSGDEGKPAEEVAATQPPKAIDVGPAWDGTGPLCCTCGGKHMVVDCPLAEASPEEQAAAMEAARRTAERRDATERRERAARWSKCPLKKARASKGPCVGCGNDVEGGDSFREGLPVPAEGHIVKRRSSKPTGVMHEACREDLAAGRDPRSESEEAPAPQGAST